MSEQSKTKETLTKHQGTGGSGEKSGTVASFTTTVGEVAEHAKESVGKTAEATTASTDNIVQQAKEMVEGTAAVVSDAVKEIYKSATEFVSKPAGSKTTEPGDSTVDTSKTEVDKPVEKAAAT